MNMKLRGDQVMLAVNKTESQSKIKMAERTGLEPASAFAR